MKLRAIVQRVLSVDALYVASVVCAGAAVVVYSVLDPAALTIDLGWVSLALLTLISGSFTVRVPGATSTISVSETFVIIAAVTYGPGPAAILVALEGLIVSLWILKNTKEAYRVFFNMATGAVSVWVSAHLFFYLTPEPLLLDTPARVATVIPALFLFATVYFLVNSWMIAVAIGLDSRRSPLSVWNSAFVILSLNYLSGASLAALLLPFIETVGIGSIFLVAPLMILAYVTFRTAMGRIADANTHLVQLNKLYLSTIETLAMAIDAKDQITHGHVRRVQTYAMGLAKRVGVTSESELKAIEAAALLHDMGKLAIPEHILNKPGKLTEAEFETMKRHADIGADILSAIDFPYPVVPIVRYHHENWDGNGYPDGLSGENIPIGARILAVVDCFDALTSDRPYRPRLPDSEALQILRDRAGNMYDPSLVSTFATIYREIAPSEAVLDEDVSVSTRETASRVESKSRQSTLDSISSSAGESRLFYELVQILSSRETVSEVADVIATHLRRYVPVSTFVLFVYDQSKDELVARHALGEHSEALPETRIRMGERISGWVAANRQSVMNSDPVLDLGDLARTQSPRLLSCLAAPIVVSQNLIGVVTLHSSRENAFSDDHRRIVEMVAGRSAQVLQQRLLAEREADRGNHSIAKVPDNEQLERNFSDQRWLNPDKSLSLVLIPARGLVDSKKCREPLCANGTLCWKRLSAVSAEYGRVHRPHASH